jgi:hypothetical protein
VVQAIRIQQTVGGKLADLLHTLADFIRARDEVRREVQVLTAEGRISAWVLGALPVFLLARKHVGSERAGLGFALVYLLLPAVEWLTLNEFHPVALACPLLLWAFLFLERDRLVAFAATAAAGGLILATGWDRFDPLASLLVAALVFAAAFELLRESGRIFLEGAPESAPPAEVGRALAEHPGVAETHDLHVWTVTSGFPALAAHVLVEPGADCHRIRLELERMLHERFGIDHTTLQVEHVGVATGLEIRSARAS